MEISSLSDVEFKTLVIRMLKSFGENSIKKIQSEMKDSLIEIKNNLQKTKVEAENQINDLEHTEEIGTYRRNKHQSEQEEEKRIQKMRIV